MNKGAKVLLIGAGVGAAIYGGSKLASMKSAGDQLTIETQVKNIKIGVSGITFDTDITLVNPSNQKFDIEFPSIKIFYKNKEIGYSDPGSTLYTLKRKSKIEIPGLHFKVALTSAASTLYDILLKDKDWKKNAFLRIFVRVNKLNLSYDKPFTE